MRIVYFSSLVYESLLLEHEQDLKLVPFNPFKWNRGKTIQIAENATSTYRDSTLLFRIRR